MAQQSFLPPNRFCALTPDDLAIWLRVSQRFRKLAPRRSGYAAPPDGSLLHQSRRDDRRDAQIMSRMGRIDPAGLVASSVAHALIATGWFAP